MKFNLPYISPHIKRSRSLLEEVDSGIVRGKAVAKFRFGSGFPGTKSRVVSSQFLPCIQPFWHTKLQVALMRSKEIKTGTKSSGKINILVGLN